MTKDYEYFSSLEDRKTYAAKLVNQTRAKRHFTVWFIASFAMLVAAAILASLPVPVTAKPVTALLVLMLTVAGLYLFTVKSVQMFTIIDGTRGIIVDGRLPDNQSRFHKTLIRIIEKTDPSGTVAPQLVLCLYAPYRFSYDTDTKLIRFSREGCGDIYVPAARLDLDAAPYMLPVKSTVQYESY